MWAKISLMLVLSMQLCARTTTNEKPSFPFEDPSVAPSPVNTSELTYLGYGGDRYWWISHNKMRKYKTYEKCDDLAIAYSSLIGRRGTNLSWNLADLEGENKQVVEYVVTDRKLDYVWVDGETLMDIRVMDENGSFDYVRSKCVGFTSIGEKTALTETYRPCNEENIFLCAAQVTQFNWQK